MGKYDTIIKTLPALPPDDLKAQEKINKVKESIAAQGEHTPTTLVEGYEKARFGTVGSIVNLADDFKKTMIELLGVEGLEDLMKEAQKIQTAYEQLLTESYENDEPGWGEYGASPNAVRLSGGETFYVRPEPQGRVEDKEKFRLWCIENGYENSLQLWPSTMNAITKELLLDGKEAPDGVKAYMRPKIVFTKG